MVGNEVNSYPIRLLVNYWELRPSTLANRLDDLLRQGVQRIATFIPWQAVESDISHTLMRFLQASAERKMKVALILTPEVGLHYPNSGIPKDVVGKLENAARHCDGGPIVSHLPPNAFALPSAFAPEFSKRYNSYLSRMDSLLVDLGRSQQNLLEGVTVILTGGFWKYYRSPRVGARTVFAEASGDFSGPAAIAYRQRLEQFFSQKEFSDPNPSAANRWKTRAMDDVNRRWFQQQSEDVFRARSFQAVRKKSRELSLEEIELYTPEADPSLTYSRFLQTVAGGHADFSRLSALVDEAASRSSMAASNPARAMVHWSGLGGFHTLADSEKQFLILKSLLMIGGAGGGILVDEREWFSLSHTFRSRADALAKLISHGELKLRNRAVYLAPHLWSPAGPLWEDLRKRVGPNVRMAASLDLLLREREANLAVVDPSFVMTRENVEKLAAWALGGRVLVLPRGPLFTETARRELERILSDTQSLDVNIGLPYRLHALGEGKIIFYDPPQEGIAPALAAQAYQTFLGAVLAVAGIQGYCRFSDSRLSAIPLERKDQGMGLFVLNETRRAVAADVIFPGEVSVSDLAIALSAPMGAELPEPVPSGRFSLEVPPCGILPLSVNDERREEAIDSRATRENALAAAKAELPGFDPTAPDVGDAGIGEAWN